MLISTIPVTRIAIEDVNLDAEDVVLCNFYSPTQRSTGRQLRRGTVMLIKEPNLVYGLEEKQRTVYIKVDSPTGI